MNKNLMAKSRKSDNPYLIYTNDNGWTWKILKAYSADPHKPYGRWFADVSSPFTFGGSDMGDTYIADVVKNATLTFADPAVPAYMIPDASKVPAAPFSW